MLQQLFTVFRGTVAAQLIGVIVLPLLSRLFAPEAFGHYQVYQSILGTLVVVAAMRLELLLLRVPEHEVLLNLQSTVLAAALISSFVAMIAAAGMVLSWPPAIKGVPFPLLLIPAALFTAGLTQAYTYFLTRQQRFSDLVRIKLAQACTYAGVAIAIGVAHPTSNGIIFADLAGRIASTSYVWILSQRDNLPLVSPHSWQASAMFGWSNRRLPLLSATGAFLNAAGCAITPIMIFGHFGATQSGQYGLMERAMLLPVAMIVASVSQVYVARLSSYLRAQDRAAIYLVNRITLVTGGLSLAAGLTLLVFLPNLFAFTFGAQWKSAGELAQLFLPACCVQVVSGVLNQSLVAMGNYGLQTAWDASIPTMISILWIIIVNFNLPLHMALAMYSAASVLLGLMFIGLVHWRIRECLPRTSSNDGAALAPQDGDS